METQFRGTFLTSESPNATAAFYRDVAGLALETVGDGGYTYWRLERGGVQFAIHEAEAFAAHAHPPNPDSNLTHLYFRVDGLRPFRARLDELGIVPLAEDDVVITVTDPDGRAVLFGTA